MKKISVVLLAFVFGLGMALTAQAANLVEVKTTVDPLLVLECEKTGSITFSLDAGTVLKAADTLAVPTPADWWLVRLSPFALCTPIDFEITAGGANANFGTIVVPDGTDTVYGPVTISDLGGVAANNGISATGVGLHFRVQGAAGDQEVVITCVGGNNDATQDTLTVLVDTVFSIKLFDSVTHGLPAPVYCLEDTGNGVGGAPDGIYGNDLPADLLEKVDNTMCVDTRTLTSIFLEVGYDSRDDFLTFTGDFRVGQISTAPNISLVRCKAGAVGQIPLADPQAGCTFDVDSLGIGTAALGYCTVAPNRIIVQNNTSTFSTGDYALRYTMVTSGVYWSSLAHGLVQYNWTNTGNNFSDCAWAGTTLNPGWNARLADNLTPVTAITTPGGCSVPASQRATVLESNAFVLPALAANQLYVNLTPAHYDLSEPNVVAGTTVTMRVELVRLPCTVIFSEDVDLGQFVDSCGAAPVAGMMLTLPYFPNPGGAYWQGVAIINNSAVDGTFDFTVYEQDGDIGMIDDAAITARGSAGCMVVWTGSDLQGALVWTGGTGSGVLGDSRFFATVAPSIGGVQTFVMFGTGVEGLGYIVP